MKVDAHLNELRKKHETLSERVAKMQQSPSVDDLEIVALKKEKLRLKEEISRLSMA
ncbi:MAG: YdcH family protein [Maritimibacter sp.]|jgi:hypothetical protein